MIKVSKGQQQVEIENGWYEAVIKDISTGEGKFGPVKVFTLELEEGITVKLFISTDEDGDIIATKQNKAGRLLQALGYDLDNLNGIDEAELLDKKLLVEIINVEGNAGGKFPTARNVASIPKKPQKIKLGE